MARHRAAHGSGDPSDAGSPETGPEQTTDEDTSADVAGDSEDGADATAVDAGDASDAGGGKEPDDEPDDKDHDEVEVERSPEADSFWSDVRIDPIEIALPSGVGFTLRAYRNDDELNPVDGDDAEDEGTDAEQTRAPAAAKGRAGSSDDSDDELDAEDEDADELDAEDEADEGAEPEEIPVFLAQRGKVLLFRSPESLVAFVRSDQPHAMRGLDTADELASRIEASYLVPAEEDRYELDLLVGNLRGGHDSWEPELIVSAGELARDIAYAAHLDSVLTSLSSGSPLDDLDEAMRGAAQGGFGAFRARRKMRKIGAQQAALGWRTIIGKISGAVDWRD